MLSEKKIKAIAELHESGMGIKTIAKKLRFDPKTVRKYIDKNSTSNSPSEKKELLLDTKGVDNGEICAKVFELLAEGIPPGEIVIRLKISPEKVKDLTLKWDELRALQFNEKTVLERLSRIEEVIKILNEKLSGTPLLGLRKKFKCDECEEAGWVAIRIECTKCEKETWYGWFPEEEED